jgi:ParB family chromosome partitioning protein
MSLIHTPEAIPLNRLKASTLNVRKTEKTAQIEELAASIAVHGLLHPLTVTALSKDGGFGVVAGGRRLAALKLLAKRKHLPKDASIPCIVTEAESSAEEVSLAENITQAPMHPADQYEAFAKLHREGMSAGDIGARFGLSARIVQQRLRLGAASPKILAAYREGDFTLEQVMAFCLTDDHAAQDAVLARLSAWQNSPGIIRRFLSEDRVEGDDRRVSFVGLDAYEAAGGRITRDLFSEEENFYLDDPALLDRLVLEKLAALAQDVRVEATPEFDYQRVGKMRRLYPQRRDLTAEEEEKLAALEREFESLSEHDPQFEADSARLEAEIEAVQGAEVFAPDDFARAGAWVCLRMNKPSLVPHATGIAEGRACLAIEERHQGWAARLPRDP